MYCTFVFAQSYMYIHVCSKCTYIHVHVHYLCVHVIVHVLMRDEKEGIKKQARSNKQQGKATQHTQGSQKNELPRVGLEPTTLYTLDMYVYCTCVHVERGNVTCTCVHCCAGV